MKTLRYFLIMLFFVPGLALAQEEPLTDSLTIDIGGVEDAGAYEALFGVDITGAAGEVIFGPLDFVVVESDGPTAPDNPEFGCDPYTAENAAEVAGNVALIARGACSFVSKVQNAAAAGAAAAVIYVSDPGQSCGQFPDGLCGEDGVVLMGGGADGCSVDGEPPLGGCSIPAISTSFNTGNDILLEIKFGEQGTATCEFCTERPAPPPPATGEAHETGVMTLSVYDYGFLGANANFAQESNGLPFAFNDIEGGLFVSSVLIAQGETVNTNPYTQTAPEFENDQPVTLITPPAPFDQAFETQYSSEELGVQVTQRSYSRSGDAFVIVDVEVENTSGANLDDVYIGIFADWDVVDDEDDTSGNDLGDFNADLALPYVTDETGAQYYGVTAIGVDALSGYSTDASTADDAQLLDALTSANEPGVDPVERAAVTGTGPYSIAAGESVTVRFAYVAGTSETELFDNAEEARGFGVATEAVTPAGTYVLGSAYPNPVTSRATIGFDLPVAQDVTLKVYDVLGREVAVLVDGVRQAGPQSVEFDTSALPSGVYVYRLEAGSTQLAERMTIVR